MNLYQANQLNAEHSLHPQFQMRGNAIYSTVHNSQFSSHSSPLYEVRGNKVYRSASHPEGRSALPMYEIKGEHVYTSVHNPNHSALPAFHLKK